MKDFRKDRLWISSRQSFRPLLLVGLIVCAGATVALCLIGTLRESAAHPPGSRVMVALQERDPTGLTDEAFRLVSVVHPVHVEGSRVFIRNNETGEVTVVNLASGDVRHVSPQSKYGDVVLDDNTVMDVGSGEPHGYWPWLSNWWHGSGPPARTWRRAPGVHYDNDNPIRVRPGEVEVYDGATGAYTAFDTANSSDVRVQHHLPDDFAPPASLEPREEPPDSDLIFGGAFSAHGPAGGGAAAAAADAPIRETPEAAEFRRHMAEFRRHIADPEESWHAALRIYQMYPDPSGNIGIDDAPAA